MGDPGMLPPQLMPHMMSPNNLLSALIAYVNQLIGSGNITQQQAGEAPFADANQLFSWIITTTGINPADLAQYLVIYVHLFILHEEPPARARLPASKKKRSKKKGSKKRSKKKGSKRKSRKY